MILGKGINDCKGWSNWKKIGKTDLRYRIYVLWKDMMYRCYSEEYKKRCPTYKECCVCKEWLKLSNFARDIEELPNYEMWANNPNQFICLDKDVRILGNIEYNKEACMFLTIKDSSKEMLGRRGISNHFIEKSREANLKIRRKIKCVLQDGSEMLFNSIKETGTYGYNRRHVLSCCNGKRKTHKGCTFSFL